MNKKLTLFFIVTLALCMFARAISASVVDDLAGSVLERRQDEGNSTDPDDPPPPPPVTSTTARSTTISSTTEPPEPPQPPPATTTSTTSTRITTTRPPPPPDDDEETTSTTSTTSTTPLPNDGDDGDDGGDDNETSSRDEPTASTTLITTTRVREVTVVITISGTPTTSIGFTSEASVIVTTPTSRNDDGTDGDEGEGGGISKSTKNTIIGVVVGVGGAIILGALAIVAYRLRKKKTAGGFGDEAGASPVSAGSSRPDAFKATLDQYHKPPGTVNPSANF